MDPRESEADLLDRCVAVAFGQATAAANQREANVFRVAGMVLGSSYSEERKRLHAASERYFAGHSDELVEPGEVVRRAWIVGFPRLRDSLYCRLAMKAVLKQTSKL